MKSSITQIISFELTEEEMNAFEIVKDILLEISDTTYEYEETTSEPFSVKVPINSACLEIIVSEGAELLKSI